MCSKERRVYFKISLNFCLRCDDIQSTLHLYINTNRITSPAAFPELKRFKFQGEFFVVFSKTCFSNINICSPKAALNSFLTLPHSYYTKTLAF